MLVWLLQSYSSSNGEKKKLWSEKAMRTDISPENEKSACPYADEKSGKVS